MREYKPNGKVRIDGMSIEDEDIPLESLENGLASLLMTVRRRYAAIYGWKYEGIPQTYIPNRRVRQYMKKIEQEDGED